MVPDSPDPRIAAAARVELQMQRYVDGHPDVARQLSAIRTDLERRIISRSGDIKQPVFSTHRSANELQQRQ